MCDNYVTITLSICSVKTQGPYSLSGKKSYRQISWIPEAARLDVIMIVSLLNLPSPVTSQFNGCTHLFRYIFSYSYLWPTYCVLSMWVKIMIPMYRLWLHGLYVLHGLRCLMSPKKPLNLITHPHSNFNRCSGEVWEWVISSHTLLFTGHVMT